MGKLCNKSVSAILTLGIETEMLLWVDKSSRLCLWLYAAGCIQPVYLQIVYKMINNTNQIYN